MLLAEAQEAVAYFLAALEERLPALDTRALHWTALTHPRPCTYADLETGPWAWRVVVDPQPPIEALTQSLQACALTTRLPVASAPQWPDAPPPVLLEQALGQAEASVLVFLTESPEDATPLECMRALNQVVWAWMDAGALLLAWPEGRVAWSKAHLDDFRPNVLGPEEVGLFVSCGTVELEGQQLTRTYGLGQFGLPDLLFAGQVDPAVLAGAAAFAVGREESLQVGDRLEHEGHRWKVASPATSSEQPSLKSRHGLVVLTGE
ncbi:MAG: hypothetical protein AMXMBFR33_47760 [Candidatus Xenobia bacterium]